MPSLRLRPVRPDDEAVVRAAQEAMRPDGFTFALGLDEADGWTAWLDALDRTRRGVDLPAGRVPAHFLLADVDGEVVGRASIRHRLDRWLRHEGGHVGYGVLPGHRGRGHATEVLRQALVVARAEGVDAVLVTCDDGNRASSAVIERAGGVLEDRVASEVDGSTVRRYWIP